MKTVLKNEQCNNNIQIRRPLLHSEWKQHEDLQQWKKKPWKHSSFVSFAIKQTNPTVLNKGKLKEGFRPTRILLGHECNTVGIAHKFQAYTPNKDKVTNLTDNFFEGIHILLLYSFFSFLVSNSLAIDAVTRRVTNNKASNVLHKTAIQNWYKSQNVNSVPHCTVEEDYLSKLINYINKRAETTINVLKFLELSIGLKFVFWRNVVGRERQAFPFSTFGEVARWAVASNKLCTFVRLGGFWPN